MPTGDAALLTEVHRILASELPLQLATGSAGTPVCTKHVYAVDETLPEPAVYGWARCETHDRDGTVLDARDWAFTATLAAVDGLFVLASFGTGGDPEAVVRSSFPPELAERVIAEGPPSGIVIGRTVPRDVCPHSSRAESPVAVALGPGDDYPAFAVLDWGAPLPVSGNAAHSWTGVPWLEVILPDGGLGWAPEDRLVPPPCDIPPTPPVPSSTTTTTAAVASPLLRSEGTLAALPSPETDPIPGAAAATGVPWGEMSPEWVLVTLADADGRSGLYLLAPDDRLFLLGGVPAADRLVDWDGRLMLSATDRHVVLTDLWTGSTAVAAGGGILSARLDPGGGFTVREHFGHRAVITTYRPDGTPAATLANLDLSDLPDELRGLGMHLPGWLHHPDGERVVLTDPSGVRLTDPSGEPIGDLAAPGLACEPVRWWTADAVLVSCIDPDYSAGDQGDMWPGSGRELWAVPLDGSAAARVGPEAGPIDEYRAPMFDAVRLDDGIAVQTGGCCECGGGLDIYRPSGAPIAPDLVQCEPHIVTVRNGRVVVRYIDFEREGWQSALAEVATDGTARRFDLGTGTVEQAVASASG